MRRIIASLLAILTLATLFSGCAGGANIELDVFEAGEALLNDCEFEYTPVPVEPDHAISVLNIDAAQIAKRDSGAQIYLALCAESPEIIVLIEAIDEKTANAINNDQISGRIDYYKDGYSQYGPAQVPKIDSCVNRVQGRYIFLIISADNTAAGKVLDGVIDGAKQG